MQAIIQIGEEELCGHENATAPEKKAKLITSSSFYYRSNMVIPRSSVHRVTPSIDILSQRKWNLDIWELNMYIVG